MKCWAENDLWHQVGDAWVTGLIQKGHLVRFKRDDIYAFVLNTYVNVASCWPAERVAINMWRKAMGLQVNGVADHLRLRGGRGGANGILVADPLVHEGPSFPNCISAAYCRWRDARRTRPNIIAHVMICLGVRYRAIGFVELVFVIAV